MTEPRWPALLRQDWRDLLFLHWEAEPERISRLLPPELELDLHQGRAYVGIVPFLVTGSRARLVPPLPGLSSFPEVNVRTYVRCPGGDPGVWFFSLDAALRAAVAGGRLAYRLPYHFARMSIVARGAEMELSSERHWPGPLPAACRLRWAATGAPRQAAPGSLEHFLIERYLLYAAQGRRLYRAHVRHEPYPVQDAQASLLEETLLAAAGIVRPSEPPIAHAARAVHVLIHPLERVD